MDGWSMYKDRMSVSGSLRDSLVKDAKTALSVMIPDSPSCKEVTINGVAQRVTITHRPNLGEKTICSLPGEHLVHGGVVRFRKSTWLISELDADDEIYDHGLMIRCNHKLRWLGKDGKIKEKWCVVEDGTKYLIGEFTERIMSIGDARIALIVPRDEDTVLLSRGARFLIDDPDSDVVMAYQITKPNKMFNIYEDQGVFKFILNEVQLTKNDNVKLRIADYNSWSPPPIDDDGAHIDSNIPVVEIVDAAIAEANKEKDDNKKGWL